MTLTIVNDVDGTSYTLESVMSVRLVRAFVIEVRCFGNEAVLHTTVRRFTLTFDSTKINYPIV